MFVGIFAAVQSEIGRSFPLLCRSPEGQPMPERTEFGNGGKPAFIEKLMEMRKTHTIELQNRDHKFPLLLLIGRPNLNHRFSNNG